MTSLLVADEALPVSDVFCPIAWREIDFVYIHSIGICLRGSASRRNVTVSSSLEFPELYHVSIELPGLVQPLFPFPGSLSIREGSGSHHDGKLLDYSSLEGVHQDAVVVNSTTCLGQFEGSGVFVEVSLEFVHTEGVDSLMSSIF